jgi:SAM-dependent methyltransferase
MNKKELYEKKYELSGLSPSPYFSQQFNYIQKIYIQKNHLKILDLGGGTGEYSLLLQQLDHDVTLFDFSIQAIQRAKSIGVDATICDDFISYNFRDKKFDVVFVKGFSLLNTDDRSSFNAIVKKMKSILASDGCIVYMGQTDLSGQWTKGGWYQLGIDSIHHYFTDFLILPAFRYQLYFPLALNRVLSSILSRFKKLTKSITLIGIIR